MAFDYVSTLPWNDPFNPWPAYNSVQVETVVDGNVVQSDVYTLTAFDPAGNTTYAGVTGVSVVYAKTNAPSDGNMFFVLKPFQGGDLQNCWAVNTPGGGITGLLNNTSRSLPVKQSGDTYGWIQTQGNVSQLRVTPVYTDLTPWEFRRRIAGGTG
jgi:hypothetical protein